ncbi:MAG: hypothetical protein BGO90_09060 [Legionella sp. 40-6]|nr:hypothetical protein [Legionella sp.]OJY21043.1 MAG: hypothetical protein BGO90_09060 [Legionella sp. 40-6]
MAKKQNKDETNHCFLLSCIVGLEVTAIASLGLLTYALYSMSTTSALAVAAFTLTASTLSTLLPFLAVGFLAVAFILGGLSCCRNDEVSYSIGIPRGPVHHQGMWAQSAYIHEHPMGHSHGHGDNHGHGNTHGHVETNHHGHIFQGNTHGHGSF